MKKLLLTSAGIVPEIKKEFISLLPKKPAKIKVAFVTTAAYGQSFNPLWLEKDLQILRECGIQQIDVLDIKDKTQKELEKIISDKDVLFVNGGNTFYLLYWLKKSGFDRVIALFVNRGGLYVGVSAGSYIACPTIEAATWKHQDNNKVGIKDLTALNFVPFLITAHFGEEYRKIVNQAAKKTDYPIAALYDTQAILVQGEKVELIGQGKKNFWNNCNETLFEKI